MSVYIHEPQINPLRTRVTADSEKELNMFAQDVGLKLDWICDEGLSTFHYQVTGTKLRLVLNHPVPVRLSLPQFEEHLKQRP